jgi:hypothetical protein
MQPDKMEEGMEKYLGCSSNALIRDPTRASGATVPHEFGMERERRRYVLVRMEEEGGRGAA